MMTLLKNRSRSSHDHDLYIQCSTGVIDASCHASLKSVNQLWRRLFERFLPYMGVAAILVM